MKLDKNSMIPLYVQLHDLLYQRIEQGVYAPGQKMPSENQLCREFSMSRPTVRQAMAELAAAGVISIEKGRGTYVTNNQQSIKLQKFNAITCSFLRPEQEFFKAFIVPTSDDLNKKLNIYYSDIDLITNDQRLDLQFNLRDQVHPGFWSIKRILKYGDQILGMLQSYLPVALFPQLAQQLSTDTRLIDITGNKYAYLPQRGSIYGKISAVNNQEATDLELARHSLVMRFQGQLFGRNGRVCEVLNVLFVPELIELEVN